MSDQITLELCSRPDDTRALIELAEISRLVSAGDGAGLLRFFKPLVDVKSEIHDSFWLRRLINWSEQQKGMDTFEMLKWSELVKKICAAENEHGSHSQYLIKISRDDAQRIVERIRNKNFTLNFSSAYIGFVEMFLDASGYKIE